MPQPEAAGSLRLHASTVAITSSGDDARAVLILGPSGAGKSGLALDLMARGAILVADDQTVLRRAGGQLLASAPAAIRGLIEARGVGLLSADTLAEAPVSLVVDLSQRETRRLPPPQDREILGCVLPLLHAVESAHFPAAILQYLKKGRSDRP